MRRFRAEDQKGNEPLNHAGSAAHSGLDASRLSSARRSRRIYLRPRAALFDRVVRLFDRVCDVRFVRDAVERAVLLRRVVRAVLRDGLRRFGLLRFVAVLRGAVDLRAVELRVVDLREVDFRADGLRGDDLRVALRDVVLRPLVLRPAALRPAVLRPDALRPDDAAVLPAPSRRFVRARLRLFSAGLS
jgi:hypothetical protein